MKNDYRIVIPSRSRMENVKATSKLLPTATWFVNEEEAEDYLRAGVAEQQLKTAAAPKSFSALRQKILDSFEEESIVQIDDDFTHIWCYVGNRMRKIEDPGAILQIIENGVHCAKDSGTSVFGWSRNHRVYQHLDCDPFHFWAVCTAAIGIVGRDLRFDSNIKIRCPDVDITLQCLLEKRFVFTDQRFLFEFGGYLAGRGGLQGVRTSEIERRDIEYMKKKWGPYLDLEVARKGGFTGVKIQVRRRM